MLAILASNACRATMHLKTLAAVFTGPVSGTIDWAIVESLPLAAGQAPETPDAFGFTLLSGKGRCRFRV